ncbi:MAG: FHA domain-containing protein [Chloroflexi bacterium]|nr:FHA domain-containing protein [Chloroflexota bacterium]
MRKVIIAILLTTMLLGGGFHARAQESARAEIISVDANAFPTITAFLDVYAPDGKFATAMEASSLTALENGNPIPITELTEKNIGAQIVIAVNPGPAMDTRDTLGISRYERAVEILRVWAETRPLEPQDEMSLVSTTGPILINATASEWRNSLVSYQPDARAAIPSLQSLSFALDLLEGQESTQVGMKQSILFLTPHLPDQATVTELENLTERASLLGVRVNVWLIDADSYFVHFSANSLKSLALQTGGDYFAYSGIETIPEPEIYFSHLRHLYTFQYQSQLASAGSHNLAARVNFSGLELTSAPYSFSLDIQPPNPMLLSPPSQIVRQAPEDDPYNTELLLPNEESIEFLIEFPDGHPRDIKRVALFVDDEKVAEITSPPFDKFTWDLSEYLTSGEHSLQIEVEDSLGLTKMSVGVPLTLTLVQPPTGILAFFGRNSTILTIGVVAITGLLLAAILLVGGTRGLKKFTKRREEKAASYDPISQPIPTLKTGQRKKRLIPLRSWAQGQREEKASAYLTRLNGNGGKAAGEAIQLTSQTITFGTDPVKVAFVLDDPSISPHHATLTQNEDGDMLISDHDSVAGTWVNFEKIEKEHILAHGDIIHIGLMRYKFSMVKPPKKSKSKVQVEVSL